MFEQLVSREKENRLDRKREVERPGKIRFVWYKEEFLKKDLLIAFKCPFIRTESSPWIWLAGVCVFSGLGAVQWSGKCGAVNW